VIVVISTRTFFSSFIFRSARFSRNSPAIPAAAAAQTLAKSPPNFSLGIMRIRVRIARNFRIE